MAITITVKAPKGAGKSYLIRKVVDLLKREGYEGVVVYSDATIDSWRGTNGVAVVIDEVDN